MDFIVVMMSGLMISQNFLIFFAVQLLRNQAWTVLHASSASLVLILTGLHFGLSWNWLMCMLKCCLHLPGLPGLKQQKQPAVVPVEVTRK